MGKHLLLEDWNPCRSGVNEMCPLLSVLFSGAKTGRKHYNTSNRRMRSAEALTQSFSSDCTTHIQTARKSINYLSCSYQCYHMILWSVRKVALLMVINIHPKTVSYVSYVSVRSVKSTIQMFSLPSQVADTDSRLLCVMDLWLETLHLNIAMQRAAFTVFWISSRDPVRGGSTWMFGILVEKLV